MGFRQETNDPVIGKLRKGTAEDPYKRIVETLQVHAGAVHLTEIPNRMERVRITYPLFPLREVDRGELTENTYRVDYTNGTVFFHSNLNEQYLVFDYMGRGAHFFPASKIYLNYDKDNFTAENKFIDIDRELKNQSSRVDNLINNNPQPSEVVDIRVDRHGYVFPTSKARIDDLQKQYDLTLVGEDGRVHTSLPKRLDAIDKTMDANDVKHTNRENDLQSQITTNKADFDQYITDRYQFDYTLIEPVYYTSLDMYEATVNQSLNIHLQTGDIYTTQTNGLTNPRESYTITRMNRSGMYLDHMIVKHGGHGTSIGLDPVGDRMFIISNYDTYNSNNQVVATNIIRFEYKPGTTLEDMTNATILNKYSTVYATPVTDVANDLIAYRFQQNNRQHVELRRLSDVKNAVNNVLGRVDIPRDLEMLQGITIDGYDLYWYTGDSTGEHPNELCLFDFRTGQMKKRITVDFGRGPDGKYEDNYREPEGMFLYKDPYSGKKSLFCVVMTGAAGKRIAKVYAYHQRDNYEKLSSEMAQWQQNFPLTGGGGKTKGIPNHITKLSQLITPGYYYMTSAEAAKYSDHPRGTDGSGWFLDVSPVSSYGATRQKLIRNSTGRTMKQMERILNRTDGSTSSWFEPTANQTLEWTNLPLRNGAKNYSGGAPLQFAVNGGLVFVRGDVVLPLNAEEIIFATIPTSVAPARTVHLLCPVAGTTGMHRIHARSEGELAAYGAMVNTPNSYTHTYVDLIYMYT